MKAGLRALWMSLLLWAASPAHALCVAPLCSCGVSTTSLAFGAYNPLANANVDSTASVRVTCGGVAGLLIPYQVALGPGGSGNTGARRLNSGAATLAYNVYTSNILAGIWGDGTGGTQLINSFIALDLLGWAPTQTHTVYGRIPLGQTAARPGIYGDTIAVTITYF